MTYQVTEELDHGIVEKRFYDEDEKLVEVRKVYPPMHVGGAKPIRWGGSVKD